MAASFPCVQPSPFKLRPSARVGISCRSTTANVLPACGRPPAPPKYSKGPDGNDCPNAGINVDLFPATMIYVTATVVDPNANTGYPVSKSFVVGPLESRLFYQIAGRRPDLNRNGVDDFIDIATGKSKDTTGDGVPDEVQGCPERTGHSGSLRTGARNPRASSRRSPPP